MVVVFQSYSLELEQLLEMNHRVKAISHFGCWEIPMKWREGTEEELIINAGRNSSERMDSCLIDAVPVLILRY